MFAIPFCFILFPSERLASSAFNVRSKIALGVRVWRLLYRLPLSLSFAWPTTKYREETGVQRQNSLDFRILMRLPQ